MPGMTHLQHAQPVLFGHHLLAHVHAFCATSSGLRDWDKRAALSPARRRRAGRLVAAAGPGRGGRASSASTRRAPTRSTPCPTATSSPSSCFVAALIGVHLSRLGEEICLWATTEFGWVELDDAYATGSSIMPQKKNPDIAELARGKSGRLIGNLMALLTTLKGLPLAYDRDLQEDKEPVFDSVDSSSWCCPRWPAWSRPCGSTSERLTAAAATGHALATDVAEWLVRTGRRFRDAHEIAGRLVRHCDEHGLELWEVDDAGLADGRPAAHPGGPVGALGPRRAAGALDPRRDRAGPGRRAARPRSPTPPTSTRPGRPVSADPLLTPEFFARPVLEVAPDLLGATVRHTSPAGPVAVRLTEVEAYAGEAGPRLARLPRPHPAQRGDVRPARAASTSTSPTACTGA